MTLTIVAQVGAAPAIIRPKALNAVADRVASRRHFCLYRAVVLAVAGWCITATVPAIAGWPVVGAVVPIAKSAVAIAEPRSG